MRRLINFSDLATVWSAIALFFILILWHDAMEFLKKQYKLILAIAGVVSLAAIIIAACYGVIIVASAIKNYNLSDSDWERFTLWFLNLKFWLIIPLALAAYAVVFFGKKDHKKFFIRLADKMPPL